MGLQSCLISHVVSVFSSVFFFPPLTGLLAPILARFISTLTFGSSSPVTSWRSTRRQWCTSRRVLPRVHAIPSILQSDESRGRGGWEQRGEKETGAESERVFEGWFDRKLGCRHKDREMKRRTVGVVKVK